MLGALSFFWKSTYHQGMWGFKVELRWGSVLQPVLLSLLILT